MTNLALELTYRPGVYWDEHGFLRECVIVEGNGLGAHGLRIAVMDAMTGEQVLDPPSAIPVVR